jgi:tRNA A-37 threonylcarbamoyl transferase component Bud32
MWWTATAKAVAGIALSLRFAHSLGLIHGHLTSKNICFDIDHRIQITGFSRLGQEVERAKPVSGRSSNPNH